MSSMALQFNQHNVSPKNEVCVDAKQQKLTTDRFTYLENYINDSKKIPVNSNLIAMADKLSHRFHQETLSQSNPENCSDFEKLSPIPPRHSLHSVETINLILDKSCVPHGHHRSDRTHSISSISSQGFSEANNGFFQEELSTTSVLYASDTIPLFFPKIRALSLSTMPDSPQDIVPRSLRRHRTFGYGNELETYENNENLNLNLELPDVLPKLTRGKKIFDKRIPYAYIDSQSSEDLSNGGYENGLIISGNILESRNNEMEEDSSDDLSIDEDEFFDESECDRLDRVIISSNSCCHDDDGLVLSYYDFGEHFPSLSFGDLYRDEEMSESTTSYSSFDISEYDYSRDMDEDLSRDFSPSKNSPYEAEKRKDEDIFSFYPLNKFENIISSPTLSSSSSPPESFPGVKTRNWNPTHFDPSPPSSLTNKQCFGNNNNNNNNNNQNEMEYDHSFHYFTDWSSISDIDGDEGEDEDEFCFPNFIPDDQIYE